MADTLPALDAPIAFVVDAGEAVGPMPLAEIVTSVSDGVRHPHSLVWWAGAADWQHFDNHEELTSLLTETGQSKPNPPRTEIFEPAAQSQAQTSEDVPPSLTGLFSASARHENGLGGTDSVPSGAAVEAIVSARSLLAAESRDDAITHARHKTLAAALSGPAALAKGALAEYPVDSIDTKTETDTQRPVDTSSEEHIDESVENAVEHHQDLERDTRIDETLLSGCIAAITERGYVAMDLSSRETEHRVLFESEKDTRFVMIETSPLDEMTPLPGETSSRHLEVNMSWGQDVTDIDAAFAVVRSLATDEEPKRGKVRAEIDATSSRVFTTVDLLWIADDFVSHEHEVDRDALDDAVAAAIHILERRWYKLFIRRR